ncbi:hypothetical protein NNW99_36160 [Streptomyces sp. CRCS-T-1]|nr:MULTISPECIES: hypothetical protein [Streptomyces]UUA10684.1 hypothetical protein NNW98_36275 [Streptomyces koelreuteriae]UUA18291.1 hypothetical protein NNW99_36160 [Streptomyces sp. CRCS-T-1]
MRYQPSRSAAAVASGCPWYPVIRPGPRTQTSPSAPSGTSSPPRGSTRRTSVPGTGAPQEPSTLGPSGRFTAIMPQVSVLPYASSSGAPRVSSTAARRAGPLGAPATTHIRSAWGSSPGESTSRRYVVGTPASMVKGPPSPSYPVSSSCLSPPGGSSSPAIRALAPTAVTPRIASEWLKLWNSGSGQSSRSSGERPKIGA